MPNIALKPTRFRYAPAVGLAPRSPLASLGENAAVSGDCLTPRSARGEPGSQDGLPATRAAAYRRIIALGEARRLLQGESPSRERVSHPPVSSLGSMAERLRGREQDGLSVDRVSCRP
jgi:hypothetical protein